MNDEFKQVPFSDTEFVDNPEPRCACLLLLDNSVSMRGSPIDQLNEGLKIFRDELAADSLASKRVEVAIVTFGPVNVEIDFTSAQNFQAPTLSVAGDTRSEEHTSELQSHLNLVFRLLLEKKNVIARRLSR